MVIVGAHHRVHFFWCFQTISHSRIAYFVLYLTEADLQVGLNKLLNLLNTLSQALQVNAGYFVYVVQDELALRSGQCIQGFYCSEQTTTGYHTRWQHGKLKLSRTCRNKRA